MKSLVRWGVGAAASLLLAAGCGGGRMLSGTGGGAGDGVITITGGGGVTGVGGFGATGRIDAGCNCCAIPQPASPVRPEILIVLDTSATMNDALDANGSKWAAATAGITAAIATTETTVNWGLAFMGATAETCGTGGITLPIGSSAFSIRE